MNHKRLIIQINQLIVICCFIFFYVYLFTAEIFIRNLPLHAIVLVYHFTPFFFILFLNILYYISTVLHSSNAIITHYKI